MIFITYSRILEIGHYEDNFIVAKFNVETFVNKDMYKDEVDITANTILTITLLYFVYLLFKTNPEKPRLPS